MILFHLLNVLPKIHSYAAAMLRPSAYTDQAPVSLFIVEEEDEEGTWGAPAKKAMATS